MRIPNSAMARVVLFVVLFSVAGGSCFAEAPTAAGNPSAAGEKDEEAPTLLSTSISGGGGETMTSDSFRMVGEIGAPDAGSASSPSYKLAGGFLGSATVGNPDPVFADGFESNDTSQWVITVP